MDHYIYEIIAAVLILGGGLSWWLRTGSKLGLLMAVGSLIYVWIKFVQPLIN